MRFEKELLEFVKSQHSDALDKIKSVKDLKNEEVKGAVKRAVEAFKKTFQPSGK